MFVAFSTHSFLNNTFKIFIFHLRRGPSKKNNENKHETPFPIGGSMFFGSQQILFFFEVVKACFLRIIKKLNCELRPLLST